MPEALSAALAVDGLWLLILGVSLAGMVRGFTGFGTAMVYLPFAAQVLTPFEALTTLVLIDVFGPLPNMPGALRVAHRGDVLRLGFGMAFAVPVGVWLLTQTEPEFFRWAVSVISLVLLLLLMQGVRYRGPMSPPLVIGTGALGGALNGLAGIPGPPVIMLYMASTLPAAVIRANLLVYLVLADFVLLGVLWTGDLLEPSALVLGLVLALPYTVSNALGGWLFRPEREKAFRVVAYLIIAGSALSGLPIRG